MTTVTPDDIPTSVTDLLWTAPFVSISPTERINLTEPDARAVLAHFWPAIEQHIREQVARELFTEAEKTASADTDPSAKARSAGLYIGAQIARGTTTTTTRSAP